MVILRLLSFSKNAFLLMAIFILPMSLIVLPQPAQAQSLGYYAHLFWGQMRLFNRARPIAEIIASPYTDEKTKQAIAQIQVAKKFADKIGLKPTKGYQEFVQLDQPYVMQALSAAKPLELEAKTWDFPITGAVPYLGFFSPERAATEAEKLAKDWDVSLRPVPAYSSLGWFADLLYSSMLGGSERDLVDLVVHESLHATLWIPDNVDFNERLANFVGMHGSLLYLREKYPGDKEKIQQALAEIKNESVFGKFIQHSVDKYKREVKTLEQKKAFYTNFPQDYKKYAQSESAQVLNINLTDWNNAKLLAFANYYTDYVRFEKVLQLCTGDIRRMIAGLKKQGRHFSGAPEEYLVELGTKNMCLADMPD